MAWSLGRKSKEYPEAVAEYIFYLKQVYPSIHYREIVRIIQRDFDYTTNHVTVKNFLDRYPVPVQLKLDFPDYHEIGDPYQARWLAVKMWGEGWQGHFRCKLDTAFSRSRYLHNGFGWGKLARDKRDRLLQNRKTQIYVKKPDQNL